MDILNKSKDMSNLFDKSYYVKTDIIITSLLGILAYFIIIKLFVQNNIIEVFSTKDFLLTSALFVLWYALVKYGTYFIIYKI